MGLISLGVKHVRQRSRAHHRPVLQRAREQHLEFADRGTPAARAAGESLRRGKCCEPAVPLLVKLGKGHQGDHCGKPCRCCRPTTNTIPTTLGFQRVLQRRLPPRAVLRSEGRSRANGRWPSLAKKDSHAVYFLNQQKVTRLDSGQLHFPRHRQDQAQSSHVRCGQQRREETRKTGQTGGNGRSLTYSPVNLNELARGKDRPADQSYRKWIAPSRSCATAARTTRCWSAIPALWEENVAEGPANGSSRRRADRTQDATIMRIDLGARVTGTNYRGDFEKRLKAVIAADQEAAGQSFSSTRSHTIISAGSRRAAPWCVEPHQARARLGRDPAASVRRPPGVPRHLRKGRGAARRFREDRRVVEPTVPTASVLRA